MQELTPRQASVLSFIENFIRKNQQPPAEREIAGHFRIHQSAVRKHLSALERKGKLHLNRDGRSRGIRLAGMAPATAVPVIEDVTPGTALIAEENIDRTMMLDAGFVGSEEAFLLHAPDGTMAAAGIMEDDLLLVRRTPSVRNGELVVARVGDTIVVRRYYDIAGRIVLEAADKKYPPIAVEHDMKFQLEGRIVALIRTMDNLSPARKKRKATPPAAGASPQQNGGEEARGRMPAEIAPAPQQNTEATGPIETTEGSVEQD